MSLTIEVPEKSEGPGIFLVNFLNGGMNPAARDVPTFTLYHASNDRTKRRKIMVAETGQLAYVGTNYDADSVSSGANACKYYVGAVNREKGTVSLHKTELFSLKPYIPGKADISQESPSKRDRSEINDMVVSSFGSEKQKRVYAAAKRNRVEAETLDSALATAVSHVEGEGTHDQADSQPVQNSGILPPHNPRAERPQDVYNISDIVSLEELKVLKRMAKVFYSSTPAELATWREQKSYPGYVTGHIDSLPSSEPSRSLKAAMLLYASFLIQMYNCSHKAFATKGLSLLKGVPPPTVVGDQLMAKFTERKQMEGGGVTYVLSRRMKDKILSHLLVLVLFIDDFSVDCTGLQEDLKLTTAKFMDYFRALGCQVTSVKRKLPETDAVTSSCKAMLAIPLNFPRPKRGRKKPAL